MRTATDLWRLRAFARAAIVFALLGSPVTAGDALDKRLEKLLAAYRAYGLPSVPASAKLARIQGEKVAKLYWDQPGRVLEPPWVKVVVIDPNSADARDALLGLEMIIQCKARAWDDLARIQLDNWIKRSGSSPEDELAKTAWDYWYPQLTKPESDWAKIGKYLKEILASRPSIFPDFSDEHPAWQKRLVRALESALVPSRAKPGSIEALIDELIEVTNSTKGNYDPRFGKVALRGFEIVPALIEHLEDNRLTRAMGEGRDGFAWQRYHYCVRDVVSDLLQQMSGSFLGGDGWLHPVDKARVQAWWEEARKIGEEAYLLRYLFGDPDSLKAGYAVQANRLMFEIIAHKYPQHLSRIYRQLLDETSESGWPTKALLDSPLPREKKLELLLYTAKSKNLERRGDALSGVLELDRPQFVKLLTEALESLPDALANKDHYWGWHPESLFTQFVVQARDPTVWATLEKANKRCEAAARMEILNVVGNYDPEKKNRKERLSFLARFLDDANLADVSGDSLQQGYYYAGYDVSSRLEVRNFAALALAWNLDLKIERRVNWTANDWAKLREDVRKALEREGIR